MQLDVAVDKSLVFAKAQKTL